MQDNNPAMPNLPNLNQPTPAPAPAPTPTVAAMPEMPPAPEPAPEPIPEPAPATPTPAPAAENPGFINTPAPDPNPVAAYNPILSSPQTQKTSSFMSNPIFFILTIVFGVTALIATTIAIFMAVNSNGKKTATTTTETTRH